MHYYLHKGLETTSSPIFRRGKQGGQNSCRGLSHSEQGYRNWGRAGGTPGPCGKKALAEARKTWAMGAVSPGTLSRRDLIGSKTSFWKEESFTN